jgi:hypothetical protein
MLRNRYCATNFRGQIHLVFQQKEKRRKLVRKERENTQQQLARNTSKTP